MLLKARLFPAPLLASHSLRGTRQNMHQHPPQAPRSPNSASMSDQREAVAEWKPSGPSLLIRFVAVIFLPTSKNNYMVSNKSVSQDTSRSQIVTRLLVRLK